jgi:hypothetical protein
VYEQWGIKMTVLTSPFAEKTSMTGGLGKFIGGVAGDILHTSSAFRDFTALAERCKLDLSPVNCVVLIVFAVSLPGVGWYGYLLTMPSAVAQCGDCNFIGKKMTFMRPNIPVMPEKATVIDEQFVVSGTPMILNRN